MITTPLNELRVRLEREDRLQRGLAAALRQDLLREVQAEDAPARSKPMAAVWQMMMKMMHRYPAHIHTQPGPAVNSIHGTQVGTQKSTL